MTYVLPMARTARARKRWQVVGWTIFVVALVIAVVLGEIGASGAARGLGLALFFLVWPLIFLAVAPPAKPGLDLVTTKYYYPPRTSRPNASGTTDSCPARPDDSIAP